MKRNATRFTSPRFPRRPLGWGEWQVSTAGGWLPRWRQDGKEIFYMYLDRRLMAAEVTIKGGTVEVGQVRPLFAATQMTQGNPLYEVSADGQHFLLRTYPVRGTTWLKALGTSRGRLSGGTHWRFQGQPIDRSI